MKQKDRDKITHIDPVLSSKNESSVDLERELWKMIEAIDPIDQLLDAPQVPVREQHSQPGNAA